ncbi:succinate dehydrogenase assembly factor 4, mitochondrial [Senna tora]|uniref:Succinate dehydrogenase assembly factor 4, mitochondrial n=1 Tax=Senna tora TaxID=362788 RepID=A0A834T7G0_9FABA|nr:succinate dehydrogenase assembly factor 4, mitochondrial [Senna tora]
MSTSLSRLLSSVTNLSAVNPALPCTRSLPLTRSASDSVTRFFCSSTQHSLSHPDNSVKEQADAPKDNLPPADTQSQEDEADDDDGHVNKETGEIGGPKGPEPTRYGDWERNGRCSDF